MAIYSPEQYYRIDGKGGLVVFGDTHFSAIFKGNHINYQEECLDAMARMIEIVQERKPNAVVLLGDLIGVSERSIRDKRFLMEVTVWLQKLNSLTNGNVYIVRGNHDIGDFPDFEYFKGVGLLKTPTELDHFVDGVHLVRYHFVGYGEESRPLRLKGEDEGVFQVVFGHNDYKISGVTNWYTTKGGVEVSQLGNFHGVDWIVSGHIHQPSPEVYSTTIIDKEVKLYYPGAVSRVSASETYNDCRYFYLFYNDVEKGIDYSAEFFGLKPASEVFEEVVDTTSEEEKLEEEKKAKANKRLNDIIQEAMDYRMHNGSLIDQIDRIPGATDEAKVVAKRYLLKSIEMV